VYVSSARSNRQRDRPFFLEITRRRGADSTIRHHRGDDHSPTFRELGPCKGRLRARGDRHGWRRARLNLPSWQIVGPRTAGTRFTLWPEPGRTGRQRSSAQATPRRPRAMGRVRDLELASDARARPDRGDVQRDRRTITRSVPRSGRAGWVPRHDRRAVNDRVRVYLGGTDVFLVEHGVTRGPATASPSRGFRAEYAGFLPHEGSRRAAPPE